MVEKVLLVVIYVIVFVLEDDWLSKLVNEIEKISIGFIVNRYLV